MKNKNSFFSKVAFWLLVVQLYGYKSCPFMRGAINFFDSCNIPYEFISTLEGDNLLNLKNRMIRKNVYNGDKIKCPQIFIGSEYIGGYSDLTRKSKNGELKEIASKSNLTSDCF